MPSDQVVVWKRGNNLFVRFPHSHTVHFPCDRLDMLVRVLHTREVAAARASGQASPKAPSGPSQEDIGKWLRANNVKRLPTGDAITKQLRAKVPDRRAMAHLEMQDMLAEY